MRPSLKHQKCETEGMAHWVKVSDPRVYFVEKRTDSTHAMVDTHTQVCSQHVCAFNLCALSGVGLCPTRHALISLVIVGCSECRAGSVLAVVALMVPSTC